MVTIGAGTRWTHTCPPCFCMLAKNLSKGNAGKRSEMEKFSVFYIKTLAKYWKRLYDYIVRKRNT